MSRAQKIRSERLEAINQTITTEAKKIFDWILELMDVDNKRGYFKPIKFCLFSDSTILRPIETGFHDTRKYDLTKAFTKCDVMTLFVKLKDVVEQEEGFLMRLDLDATYCESKAIIFEIVIS